MLQQEDPQGAPEILKTTSKTRPTKGPRDSLILLQQEDPQGALETVKTTSKTRPTRGPEIL